MLYSKCCTLPNISSGSLIYLVHRWKNLSIRTTDGINWQKVGHVLSDKEYLKFFWKLLFIYSNNSGKLSDIPIER
jgi:hypothetical protein